MIGFFLVSLCKSIPVLGIVFYISVATDEWFTFIDSDNFDNLSPLVDDIALFVSFYHSGLNMIKIIDSILHVDIMVDLDVLGIEHFFVVRHI